MNNSAPEFLLFVQHGWADTADDIAAMAKRWLMPEKFANYLIAPNLGWLNTWLPMTPMIAHLERIAIDARRNYPDVPWRIVAHSMGGVLWLEVLHRHPEWWSQVHSLVLIGSPVGGAHMAKIFDPFGWFPLVGRDLGRNRRSIAESIAAQIPTLSIVSNIGMDTDGLVALSSSWFRHSKYVELQGIRHSALKYHPQVAAVIRDFWQCLLAPSVPSPSFSNHIYFNHSFTDSELKPWPTFPHLGTLAPQILAQLHQLPLTDCDSKHHQQAKLWHKLAEDGEIRVWQNLWGVIHIYLIVHDRCVYSGYAGWQHRKIIQDWLGQMRDPEADFLITKEKD